MSLHSAPKKAAGKGRPCPAAFLVLLVLSELCFLGPQFMNLLTEYAGQYWIGTYRESTAALDQEEQKEALREAEQYNRELFIKQKDTLFSYQGEKASDARYESLLNYGEDGVMGFLDIPDAGIFLPIVHGTGGDTLKYACGHMYGTSLPVGGESSKAVLAGHTGLPTAELFTNLTKLTEGECFTVSTGGKRLFYRVCNITVTLPEEESQYLQIEDGRDLVTLYTCTPYGINDHRLLVTGERVPAEEVQEEEKELLLERRNAMTTAGLILCTCPLIITVLAGGIMVKKTKTSRKEDR